MNFIKQLIKFIVGFTVFAGGIILFFEWLDEKSPDPMRKYVIDDEFDD